MSRLGNRRALEDLRTLRRKLAVDLKGRAGYDFSLPIGQIDDDIAVIEAGLDRLAGRFSAWSKAPQDRVFILPNCVDVISLLPNREMWISRNDTTS